MEQSLPVVSIGMPVYNGGEFIREALDCLLGQDYTDFELIISDNASIDDTQEICLQYVNKDRRIKYYRNIHNLGPKLNFLKVLELAQGQYFMWAAHDDLWGSSFISTLLEHFVSNQNVLLAMTETQYKLSNGTYLPFFAQGRAFYAKKENETQLERLLKVVNYNFDNLIYGLYKKEVLFRKSGNSILSEMTFSNENPLFLHVASKGSIVVDSTPLFYKTAPLPTYLQASREHNFSPLLSEICCYQVTSQDKVITSSEKNVKKNNGVIAFVKYKVRPIKILFMKIFDTNTVGYHWKTIARYHWKAWLDIRASIFNIEAGFLTKIIVSLAFLRGLIKHYLKMIIIWNMEDAFNKKHE